MKIKVTAADIKKGYKNVGHGQKCPVALAFKRAGVKFDWVGSSIWYPNKDSSFNKPLPEKAVKFITSIFRRQEVKPFTFNLNVSK